MCQQNHRQEGQGLFLKDDREIREQWTPQMVPVTFTVSVFAVDIFVVSISVK